MADLIDRVNESNAAEQAALDRYVEARDYGGVAADETGRRCGHCSFPLREGFDVVEGGFCSTLCAKGGSYLGEVPA